MENKVKSIYKLSNTEKREIEVLSNQLNFGSQTELEKLKLAKDLSKHLPKNLQSFLKSFLDENVIDDIVIIQNLPYDRNIITPNDNKSFIGETLMLARCQSIINEFIGEMVSYEAEADGRLFQDMVPNKKLMETQTSLGSKTELELHTEQAFSELRPDFLSLACLKGDKNAKTYYLHVDDIINNLNQNDVELLEKELWSIGVDLSFVLNGCSGEIRGPISIMKDKHLVFDQDLMIGTNEGSKRVIERIINIYFKHRKYYILAPGDALIINNHKLLHGRSKFEPKFDGNDRFIIRSFIVNDIDKIKNKCNTRDRMVDTKYS